MKECYKIKIEPLTAVHIGTGNSLSLLDYKLKTSSGLIKYQETEIAMKRLISSYFFLVGQ